jgi:hypothetical protein
MQVNANRAWKGWKEQTFLTNGLVSSKVPPHNFLLLPTIGYLQPLEPASATPSLSAEKEFPGFRMS